MKLKNTLFGSLALGAAALLMAPPEPAQGFNLLGHSLNLLVRDFRVLNNFVDTQANNNTTEEANFPGYTGAVLAIWKACVEWGSGPHADGTSLDPTQPNIGDGGANFDPSFQGLATSASSANTHAALAGSSGGVFAFMQGGGGGWSIRYYEGWTWADGPGTVAFSVVDLQNVACHEFGHALGLDHSGNFQATMYASTSPGAENGRSINADDIAGVQAIYGVKNASKPTITDVQVTGGGTELTITGTNFSPSNNEVWFTPLAANTFGVLKVTGVTSNGSSIVVGVPTGAGPGDVLVRNDGTGNANLSNAWPYDAIGPDPVGPTILNISPAQVSSIYPFNEQVVTITGNEFDSVTEVLVDGQSLGGFQPLWTKVSDTEITFAVPTQDTANVTVQVELVSAFGNATVDLDVVPPSSPVVRLGTGVQPETLFSLLPIDFKMGGTPGNIHFLYASLSDTPSCVPAICLDIGNFFSQLVFLGGFVIEDKGWTDFSITGATLPGGTTFWVQSAEYDVLTAAPPLVPSNVSEAFWFF